MDQWDWIFTQMNTGQYTVTLIHRAIYRCLDPGTYQDTYAYQTKRVKAKNQNLKACKILSVPGDEEGLMLARTGS